MTKRQQTKLYTTLISLVLALVIGIAQQQGWLKQDAATTQKTTVTPTITTGTYPIDHFVDGDTIAVKIGEKTETVRMLGVDTPETHKPNTPVQCYGPAAAAYTKNLIGTQLVRLEADPTNDDRDKYGRLLRYVYLPDNRLVEQQIIENGYGFAYTVFPFTKKQDFIAYEQAAKQASRGLWGACTVSTASGHQETNAAN